MKGLWKHLIGIGVHEGIDADLKRRIMLVNAVTGVIVVNVAFYVVFFATFSSFLATMAAVWLIAYVAILGLNYLQRYTGARVLFLLTQNGIIGTFTNALGPEVGLHYLIFATSAYTVLLFQPRRRVLIGTLIAVTIGYFHLLHWTDYNLFPFIPRFELTLGQQDALFYLFGTTGFIVLLAAVGYFSKLYALGESALQSEREARKVADEANRAKSQFLANMSHELRTPLNAIIGYAELVQESLEDDDVGEEAVTGDLASIHRAGHHLLALVNDVLDLSKIEAERFDLTLSAVDVREVLPAISDQAIPLCQKQGNTFTMEVEDDLPTIDADPLKFKQVLLNLISNAAKFTDDGEITLRLYTRGKELLIEVEDNGVGIPEEKLESIFDAFTQVDDSYTRTKQGTGLGLALSKRFVELMRGELHVESTVGEGSRFTITLPTDGQTPQKAHAPQADSDARATTLTELSSSAELQALAPVDPR